MGVSPYLQFHCIIKIGVSQSFPLLLCIFLHIQFEVQKSPDTITVSGLFACAAFLLTQYGGATRI